jgi:hypothetical protein
MRVKFPQGLHCHISVVCNTNAHPWKKGSKNPWFALSFHFYLLETSSLHLPQNTRTFWIAPPCLIPHLSLCEIHNHLIKVVRTWSINNSINTYEDMDSSPTINHISMDTYPITIIYGCHLITRTCQELGRLYGFDSGFLDLLVHKFIKCGASRIGPMHVQIIRDL